MNWLAHIHLSEPSAAFRLGNVLPDMVGARELAALPAEFQRGAKCHHRIDAFTDVHPRFRQSVARLSSRSRRVGGSGEGLRCPLVVGVCALELARVYAGFKQVFAAVYPELMTHVAVSG